MNEENSRKKKICMYTYTYVFALHEYVSMLIRCYE